MFGFWMIASIVVVAFALIVWASISAARLYEAKRNLVKKQLQSVANQFDGHLVERGWNGKPKLVLNHLGKRFLVSILPQNIHDEAGNSCGTYHKCNNIHITSECSNPEFRLSVVANSIGARFTGWFDKSRCKTGDANFDQKFLVSANKYTDSIELILNRNVRHELLVGSAFYLRAVKKEASKVKPKEPTKRRMRPRYQVPLATVSQLNKGRISMTVEGGQSETRILVHEAEYARLGEILQSVMQAMQEIDRNCSLLGKNQKQLEKV